MNEEYVCSTYVYMCTLIFVALFLSGYNRNTTIIANEFAWIGANAIASWGFTNDSTIMVTGDIIFSKFKRFSLFIILLV